MSACVVCVVVLAVLYGSMWQELSWGLPSVEILLVCARQARKLVMMWQELSLGPTLAEKLWCVHGTRGS